MAITSTAAKKSTAIIFIASQPHAAGSDDAIAARRRAGNATRLVVRHALARREHDRLWADMRRLLSDETVAACFAGCDFTKRQQQRHYDDDRKHDDHLNPLPLCGAR